LRKNYHLFWPKYLKQTYTLLSLFRTNQLFANVLLIAYIFLVRGSIFVIPAGNHFRPQGVLSYELIQRIGSQHWVEPIISLGLVLFQAILINVIVARYRMTSDQSLFPGVFYILLVSSIPHFLGLNAALLATTFLIGSFFELFESYRKPSAATSIFNAGLLLGLASLFYFSTFIFILWAIIAINTVRSGSFKEALMIFIGFLMIYFAVGTVYFLTDSFSIFWNEHFGRNIAILNINYKISYWIGGAYIFYFALILFSIVSQGFYSSKRSIQIQKYQTVLYWLMLFVGITVFFQTKVDIDCIILLLPAIAIFLSYNFLGMKSTYAEALHLFFLAVILILHFHTYLGFQI
jgi:hypothetical protein